MCVLWDVYHGAAVVMHVMGGSDLKNEKMLFPLAVLLCEACDVRLS